MSVSVPPQSHSCLSKEKGSGYQAWLWLKTKTQPGEPGTCRPGGSFPLPKLSSFGHLAHILVDTWGGVSP